MRRFLPAIKSAVWLFVGCLSCGVGAQAPEQRQLRFLIYGLEDLNIASIDLKGNAHGLVPVILKQALAGSDWQATFEYATRQRAESLLYQGRADALLLSQEWAADPDALLFSQPLYYHKEYLYSASPMPPTRKTEYLVRDKTICVRAGYRYPGISHFIADNTAYAVPLSSHPLMLRMLLNGRCELAPLSEYRVLATLADLPDDAVVYRSLEPISKVPVTLAFHPSVSEVRERVDQHLQALKNEGVLSDTVSHQFLQAGREAMAERIQAPTPLEVITAEEPPFITLNDQGELSGYATELVKGILEEAGIEAQMNLRPWARVERDVTERSDVLAFALARSANREESYDWITPITGNIFGVYALKKNAQALSSIEKLTDVKTIGVLRGDVRLEILEELEHPDPVPLNSWNQAIQSLLRERTDALFFSDAGVDYFCEQMSEDCSEIVRIMIYQELYSYLVLSRAHSNPATVEVLQRAAQRYKQSEAYQQMVSSWLEEYQRTLSMPMHLEDGILKLWSK